jgi:hypothetical protein
MINPAGRGFPRPHSRRSPRQRRYAFLSRDDAAALIEGDRLIMRQPKRKLRARVAIGNVQHFARDQGSHIAIRLGKRLANRNRQRHHERKRAELEIQQLNLNLERAPPNARSNSMAANKELETFPTPSPTTCATLRAITAFANILAEDYSDTLDQEGKEHIQRILLGGAE